MTPGQYIIFVVIMAALFMNIWNGYLNVHQKEIGMMQTIGVNDKYIFKKYWIKSAISIAVSTFVSFVMYVLFQFYNYYLYIQSSSKQNIIAKEETKQFMNAHLMNGYRYYRSNQILFIVVIAVALILMTYLSTKRILNRDMIEKMKEE